MFHNLKQKQKRNNLDHQALLKTEEMFSNFNNKKTPDFKDFQERLKQEIIEKRRVKFFMKILSPKILAPLAALVLIVAIGFGFYFYQPKVNKIAEEKPYSKSGEMDYNKNLFQLDLIKPVFASVQELTHTVKANLNTSATKAKVSELSNLEAFKELEGIELTDAQKQSLEEQGFFLVDNDIIGNQDNYDNQDDFVDSYEIFRGSWAKELREPQDAVFVSSDVGLHLYHILVDRTFQRMEEVKFQPMLRSMTRVLFEDSLNGYKQATDTKLKDSYKRLSVYYLIPLTVLDAGSQSAGAELRPDDFENYAEYMEALDKRNIAVTEGDLKFSLDKNYRGEELPQEIYDLAKAELDLIRKAEGLTESPLFTPYRPELLNDYSQFKPRSHYTKNDVLKSYFIAMMWYGRMGFTLSSDDLTRDALLITGQINNLKVGDKKLGDMWSDMSAVIEFFVGQVDDLTPYQYTQLMEKIYGEEITGDEFVDDAKLKTFINTAVETLPAPQIISEALAVYDNLDERKETLKNIMQFRFMGQRFTPDAFILSNLTQGAGAPDEETGQKLPSMPTALMPISLLNPENQLVKDYLDKWVAEKAPESDKVIAKFYNILKSEFQPDDSGYWFANIYKNWLYTFKALLSGYGNGYPFFMTTEAWMKKNLGTVLGSYTELKHDTLLYAKQSYAELGAGGPEGGKLTYPKGYVEADVTFWQRLNQLAKMTKEGLSERDFMPEEFAERFNTFIDFTDFFIKVSEKELNNEIISDGDFERIRVISGEFSRITQPLPGQELTKKEKRAGIIADIHTDAYKGEILYEATGKPYVIFTAIKDANGARLTRGAVFSHYEFTNPLTTRLADEDWQKKVYEGEGKLPTTDDWSADLLR